MHLSRENAFILALIVALVPIALLAVYLISTGMDRRRTEVRCREILAFIGSHSDGVLSHEIAEGCGFAHEYTRSLLRRLNREMLIMKRHRLLRADEEVTRGPDAKSYRNDASGQIVEDQDFGWGRSMPSSDMASPKRYFLTPQGKAFLAKRRAA